MKKLQLAKTEVKYLGQKLTKEGVQIDTQRVKAIRDMPKPKNRKQLQRWLGMVTYLSKFLPNVATDLIPLRKLLQKDAEWDWHEAYDKMIDDVSDDIAKATTLTYFNVADPVEIQVDASPEGMGAALIQNGKPVSFASTALTAPQTRYAHIEKELLAVTFGCEKFHQYVYGRKFVVYTDHKPLINMAKKPLAALTSRIQRLFLRLQRYDVELIYRPGKEMALSDTLSRAPCQDQMFETPDEDIQVHELLEQYKERDLKIEEIAKATREDKTLQTLKTVLKEGWPSHFKEVPQDLKQFWKVKEELLTHGEVILKGDRILIPESLRADMLSKLHEAHQGIHNTIERARSALYWPSMSKNIRDMISKCNVCNKFQNINHHEPPMAHEIEKAPWVKVAIDFFDFKGMKYIEIIDYYSKYIEVMRLDNLKAHTVIPCIKSIFARHGIPQRVVTDGGPPFNGKEFELFARGWKFIHTRTSPLHPQSNGQVERAIQTMKKTFHKVLIDANDPYLALLTWRTTPVQGSKKTPSQLSMGRELNTLLPRLKTFSEHQGKPEENKQKRTRNMNLRPISQGQKVWARTEDRSWRPAMVENTRPEPRSYILRTPQGTTITRNRRHIRVNHGEQRPEIQEDFDSDIEGPDFAAAEAPNRNIPQRQPIPRPQARVSSRGREIRAPARFKDYIMN